MSNYRQLLERKGRVFLTPQDFLVEAVKYFEWCDDNPLLEDTIFQYQGHIIRTNKDKVRPYTKNGLATFAGIPVHRLESYRNRGEQWADAVAMIEQVMHDQKFTNAVAGLMNTTMIKSDLQMVDRQELTGKDGGAIETKDVGAEEAILNEARRLGIPIEAFGFTGGTEEV